MKAIAYILIICLLSACECLRPAAPIILNDREVIVKDSTIYTPGATVYAIISDTVFDRTVTKQYFYDSSQKALLSYYKDAYGRLVVRCDALRDTLIVPIKSTHEVRYIDKESEHNGWRWYVWLLIGIGLACVIAITIRKL